MSAAALAPLRAFEEWESRASLADKQLESIAFLQGLSAELPVPLELAALQASAMLDDASDGTAAASASAASNALQSLPATARPSTSNGPAVATIESTIETTQQFLAWFAKVEEEMERGQEDIYRAYLATMRGYRQATVEILSKTEETHAFLDDLERNYNFVEEKTKGLQQACETLLDEQTHLISVAEELAAKLAYFNELDPITKMLSAPGETIVMDDKFGPMLQKLDQCLAFVLDHPHYKDAEVYRMRYRQCMTRCMTLIKMHFVDNIRALQNDIREKLAGRQTHEPLAANMQLTLFYVKFRTQALKVKGLIAEVEERCSRHAEYLALLRDCFSAYFVVRRTLLTPFISEHIRSINNASLLDFVANGCAYMIRLCADEYQLFRQFFTLGEEEVLSYLESLATGLYDQLRPLILRELKIDTLSDMCQSLLSYLKTMEPQTQAAGDTGASAQANTAPVKFIVQKILEDAQQRLVFRAEAFIQQELQKFKPREEELLVLARGRGLPQPMSINLSVGVTPMLNESINPPSSSVASGADMTARSPSALLSPNLEAAFDVTEAEAASSFVIGKLAYGGGEWYPTMQRTLYLLGRLYGAVPRPIFEDLAQEAVDACRTTLLAAADVLTSKQTKLDGQLFLIKNLLMLREQISSFDARFVRREETLNYSEMLEAVRDVIKNSWRAPLMSFSGAIMAAASAPRVIQSYADANEALGRDLRRTCEDLILETAKGAVEPVASFMLKVSAFRLRNDARPPASRDTLQNQSFAQPNQIGVVFEAFKETTQRRLVATVTRMSDYIGDKKTQAVLIRIIRSQILDNYQAFVETVVAEYDASTAARIVSVADMAALIDSACERGLLASASAVTPAASASATPRGSVTAREPPAAA
ncbi:Sec34-like family-domain-containing protein [Entophlyctis helioformis]|nr:Sec34-like family-domain-containing protein [Entophlyctis helioformis]